MRADRGVFWNEYRQTLVRKALLRGDDRSLIAERLGITQRVLKDAIKRFKLRHAEAA